jgi:hypothetical protein
LLYSIADSAVGHIFQAIALYIRRQPFLIRGVANNVIRYPFPIEVFSVIAALVFSSALTNGVLISPRAP